MAELNEPLFVFLHKKAKIERFDESASDHQELGSIPERWQTPGRTSQGVCRGLLLLSGGKKATKRKLPKRNLLRFCLWPLENVSLPTAKDDALDCATDEWGSEIDVQIFPWLLWPSARIVPL